MQYCLLLNAYSGRMHAFMHVSPDPGGGGHCEIGSLRAMSWNELENRTIRQLQTQRHVQNSCSACCNRGPGYVFLM
jgi:hypothetical protein